MVRSRGSLARPRRVLFRGAIVATVVLVANGHVAPAARAATVDSDRAQIAQIQKQISEKGAEIESLVRLANEARANLDALHLQIRRDEQLLAADDRAERAALVLVRKAAVAAYISRSGGGSELSMLQGTSSITRAMGGRHYLDSVNSHWDDSIVKLQLAKARTDDDRRNLLKQQDDAQRVLDRLTRAQADASAAITAQNAALTRVRSDLTSLLITQKHQKEAQARRAAERADRGRARGGDPGRGCGAGRRASRSRAPAQSSEDHGAAAETRHEW